MKQRVELHLHTKMSDDPSVITAEELVLIPWSLEHPAVAITDLNSVQSFADVAKHLKKFKNPPKVIYGAEVNYRQGEKTGKVALLARNIAGLRGLYRIISALEDEAVDWQIIEKNRENLLVGAASWAMEVEDVTLYDYIAITPTTRQEEQCRQWHLYTRAKEQQIPVAAVGNCHYIAQEDQICKDIADWARHTPRNQEGVPFLTTEEMLEAVSYLGEHVAWEVTVDNTNKLADMVDAVKPMNREYPALFLPHAYEIISNHCQERLVTLYGENPPAEIRARLDAELARVAPHATGCLLPHYLVRHLHDLGGFTGCRGTIGSLLIAYLLDISDVNPLPAHYRCPACKHVEFADAVSGYDLPEKICPHCGKMMHGDGQNIPYETCLGPLGETWLDIDINTTKALQKEAKEFVAELLGKDRMVLAGTVATFTERLAAAYVQGYFQHREEEISPEEAERITHKLTGVKRTYSVMPWGLVLLPKGMEWEDATPLQTLTESVSGIRKATHMDYYDVWEALPKLDVLSYGVLDRVEKLFAVTGRKPEDIDYHDPKVYQLIRDLDTCGVPEFSSEFIKGVIRRVGVRGFSDLLRISGMSHGTNVWTGNAGELIMDHPFCDLIGDRDDIFLTLRSHGLDPQTAHKIMTITRKGRFREDTQNNRELTEIMQRAGVPEWYIGSMKKIWYLFPKAHGAHYTQLAFTLAWFKAYYPRQFYAVSLEEMGAEEFAHFTDAELEQRLEEVRAEDYVRHNEADTIALLLEARRRNYL